MAERKRVLAMERWKILKKAVLAAKKDSAIQQNVASVRRFNRFGVLAICVPPPDSVHALPSPGQWMQYSYTSSDSPNPPLMVESSIKLLEDRVSLEAMMGFNNTGNVCVWPSEEVMAYYCLEHRSMFQGAAVCELGSGMTGLAGLMLACTNTPSCVVLTDGNETSVQNVRENVLANQWQFGDTEVSASVLLWDTASVKSSAFCGVFDYVICADCLFFEDLHSELAQVIGTLLKPARGKALLFAPRRGNTLDNFCTVAKKYFKVEQTMQYNEMVWRMHQETSRDNELYSPDLHYPLQITLTH